MNNKKLQSTLVIARQWELPCNMNLIQLKTVSLLVPHPYLISHIATCSPPWEYTLTHTDTHILSQSKKKYTQRHIVFLADALSPPVSRRRAKSAGGPRAESDGQSLQAGAGQAGRRRDAHRGVYSQVQDCEYFTCSAGIQLDCCGASSQFLEMSVVEVVGPLSDMMELEAMSPETTTCLPPTNHITAQTWMRNLMNSVHLG